MRDTTLLQLALALTPPWTVSRSDFELIKGGRGVGGERLVARQDERLDRKSVV